MKSPSEHDCVRLIETVAEDCENFLAGATGIVVNVYNGGEAFAVEVIEGRKLPEIILVPALRLEVFET